MSIALQRIYSFLVHPDKRKEEQSKIRGTKVDSSTRLIEMLQKIFDSADEECEYEITFDSASDGKQHNPRRDQIIAFMRQPGLNSGRRIALELQAVTTTNSGLGLFFILYGESNGNKKIVLSRFPANSGILADEGEDDLTVEFVEKVFMKSATAYKAAVYRGKSLDGDFWDGRAIDRQTNSEILAISNYWIKHFLLSDFRATSAQGTKRLAAALLVATRNATDAAVKQEIIAAARLSGGLTGKSTSIKDFCRRFHLSPNATETIQKQVRNDAVYTEKFRFNRDEFAKHIVIQSVELKNGAILMASAADFDKVFEQKILNESNNDVQFSTHGQIVDQRLKRKRS